MKQNDLPKRVVTIEIVVARYCYDYPKHEDPQILLMRLKDDSWSLPGTVLEADMTPTAAAVHGLLTDTGLSIHEGLLEFRTVNSAEVPSPGVSTLGLVYRVSFREHVPVMTFMKPGPEIEELKWVGLPSIFTKAFGPIAFDHAKLIKQSMTGFKA